MLPEAKILRMDVDTTRKKGAHERLLAKFGAHEADILLGTQMINKRRIPPSIQHQDDLFFSGQTFSDLIK